MTYDEIKQKIEDAFSEAKDEIFEIAEEILKNPEIGYFEENTSSLVKNILKKYGIEYTYPHAITGVKAKIGNGQGPNIAILGELDSVICQGHRYANKDGSAHACGHHAQMAALLGSAIAIKKSGIMDSLDGTITFLACPAEEFIDLENRGKLKDEGKISFFGGKQQLIAEGAFDDIDIAIMLHAQPDEESPKVYVRGENLGFLAKTITFRGKAVHGSTPFDGTNALNAAALAILGIHSNRETFRDEDRIRIHPIITKGGDVVNSVPDEVCIDTYVRGATFDAIKKGNNAVERAIHGATTMIGASVESVDIPGYLPLKESLELSDVFEEVAKDLLGDDGLVYGEPITGSSDIGDLSSVLPVIQPSIGGFKGKLHSKEFEVTDKDTAYILSGKLLTLTAVKLLINNSKNAKKVITSFKPLMNKEDYIKYLKGE